jgi:hypothetical protein
MIRTFNLQPVPSEAGIHFASTATMCVIIVSYVFFVTYIRREGLESFRMQNELKFGVELAAEGSFSTCGVMGV